IAETYYQSSQNELVNLQQRNSQTEKVILKLENELFDLQQRNLKFEQNNQNLKQRNFEFEQNNQNLRLNLAKQINKFAEKENILQTQIIDLQNEKQNLAGILINLTEQLKQNKLTNQKVQDQISQLKQDEIKLQEKLAQTEANIQELKSHKESLIEQKEQLEVNYEQIKQEKIRLQNMVSDLLQDQKFTTELKAKLAKLEKEIAQLEQKLIIEEQIKIQLTQALQIKEDRINELEQELINLDQERIKKLQDKRKELSEIEKELLNKLTIGKNTKEIHKEKDAKQKEMNELQQELLRTSASYDANRKKLIFNQVNNFLKVKGGFLTLREEAIKKLQNCCNNLESSINKKRNTIGSIRDMKTSKLTDKYTKEFQSILVKYNDGLLELNKNYYSLKKIVQENKELEVSLITENILKLNSFDLDKYKIFKFATNSQEGTRIQLNTNMMSEDINSLRKNLNELKLELNQEKKELKNLAT
ncbi:22646_t:CDS:1, partial [Rhizophagus irregularis]